MSSLSRMLLLGIFAAAGVGAAICVALSDPTPASGIPKSRTAVAVTPEAAAPHPAKARDEVVSSEAAPNCRYLVAQPAPLVEVHSSQSADRPDLQPSESASSADAARPSLAMTEEPAPAIEQQIPAPRSPEAREKVREGLDELRDLLEQNAKDSPSPEPVDKPGASSREASPPAAQNGAGARPSSTADQSSKAKPKITKSGEGDDHLSLDVQDADIRDVLELISREGNLNILPSNSVKGKVSASLHGVDIQTALAAILKSTGYVTRRHGTMIYVGTAKDFQDLEQALDKIGTRIYQTNYVRAADLQALITPILTQGIGTISVTPPSESGIAADNTKAGGDTFAGGDSVLVHDYESVLAQVDQVVAEVDKRPMQVAIEAMILSVKLDDQNSFGVNFQALRDNAHIKLTSGNPPSSLANVDVSNGGLNFAFLDSSLSLFLQALETVGDTNVIATPRLTCVNKHRAEILIGSQLGYISSTVTETSTAQNVNFLEVGAQLRLRPFISSDGLIRMEVHPELSTGQVTIQGGFTLPEKDVTQVTTNVMVRDGATVIIGGLMREDLTSNVTQIPLLGSLPGVGFLFRQKTDHTQKSEILVLITPHIIYDAEACAEGSKGAADFHRRQAIYADQMSPIGKRNLGRQHYRLAQQAWAAGDQATALRFIDLSIHY
ncbi:MAG TPA: hypothetical protein VG056_11130, partial [Pirellulales bacterium]|nr:hypothetical protein [Pirellulales bacterium]